MDLCYRLVAIDLDGTLLTDNKKISQRAVAAIKRCSYLGVRVVLATARPPRASIPYHNALELGAWLISYNGALIIDPQTRKVLYHQPITVELAMDAVEFVRSHYADINVSGEVMDRLYSDRSQRDHVSPGERGLKPVAVGPTESWLVRPFTKIMFSGPEEVMRPISGELADAYRNLLTVVMVENDVIQVTHALATKGVALSYAANEYGVPQDQVLAMGDAANDIGMLLWAGRSAAMDNAHPMVKESADMVCSSNENNGVAEVLETVVLNGKLTDS
jgi:hypothetical protein